MHTFRPDVPFLYDATTRFTLGGHQILEQGHDLLLVTAGYMAHEAKKAVAGLKDQGIEATLVDLYSIPFDAEAIIALAQDNQGRVLTLEDNYGAGMGSAVADVLSEHGGGFMLTQMCVRQIPKSGRTPDDVLGYLGSSAEDVIKTALEMVVVGHDR